MAAVTSGGVARSRDAVVVVPGIMGSELVDAESGRVLWGLADPRWYVSAWTTGTSLQALALSPKEREGRYGRVRASRLLQFPAFAPVLAGFAPYTKLLAGLRAVTCHQEAVAEFPYDWRLPVAHNSRLLAGFAAAHLARWRAHPMAKAARRAARDGQPARLVLVAHSMGGLLAAGACADERLDGLVRAVLTLGTPSYGAPKAVLMLGSGRGAPALPRGRLRRLVAGLPGVYDLLPSYRCISDGTSARRLTAADVAALGGDPELAASSLSRSVRRSATTPWRTGAELVQVAGAHQPTVQALTFDAGTVTGHRYTYQPTAGGVAQVDLGGDGTVPRESAALPDTTVMPLAQSHGALAGSAEAVLVAQDVLTDRRTGPWQGAGELGLDLPDLITAGQPYQVGVTGLDRPTDASCTVLDLRIGLRVDTPTLVRRGGGIAGAGRPLPAGLYHVRLHGHGTSPVTQLLMATPPPDLPGASEAADFDEAERPA
jgi:Lecithin:cholesterol acyltransferase